ncbi:MULTISPECIES: hypothetical protein [Photorhabdus]|uniref:hypothetical protein n=1 Tax=Photorhabdus TaxID=29487 RepID=UPI0002EA9943|nr:hypothetical protein [Photorhabdus asymbiotica]
MTGVSESSQQSSDLKDEGYIRFKSVIIFFIFYNNLIFKSIYFLIFLISQIVIALKGV